MEAAVSTADEGALLAVAMEPSCYDRQFYIAGDGRCDGCALDAHGRRAEMTENQHIVQDQVRKDGCDTCNHRNSRPSGFTHGAGIGIAEGKRNKAPVGHGQIILAVLQHQRRIGGVTFTLQIQFDERFAENQEEADSKQRQNCASQHLEPEGIANTLLIVTSVELCRKNTRTGTGAKNAQAENKHQTVDDGNAAHLQAAHLSDHDVIQHGNEIGNAVLDNNRNCNLEKTAIKLLISHQITKHKKPRQIIVISPDIIAKKCGGNKSPPHIFLRKFS